MDVRPSAGVVLPVSGEASPLLDEASDTEREEEEEAMMCELKWRGWWREVWMRSERQGQELDDICKEEDPLRLNFPRLAFLDRWA